LTSKVGDTEQKISSEVKSQRDESCSIALHLRDPPQGLYKEVWFLMGFYLISFELVKIQMYDFAVCFVTIYYYRLQKMARKYW
jgi:hypothetical protein